MTWRFEQIGFAVNQDETDPKVGVYTFRVVTPRGVLQVMTDVSFSSDGKEITLSGLHVGGAAINTVGMANLRALGQAFCEVTEYEELVVHGGRRTTGACPGPLPESSQVLLMRTCSCWHRKS